MLPDLFLNALENAINKYIHLDPSSRSRLTPLNDKIVAIHVRGLDIRFYLFFSANGVHLQKNFQGATHTQISGTPFGLFCLGTQSNEKGAAFSQDVAVTGDLELGQLVKDFFANVDIDWEEHLSHCVGDIAAHSIANVTRNTLAWSKQTATTLRQDLSEYLQEEARHFPSREEVNDFLSDVDKLRDDYERIEARLSRLEN